MNTSEVNNVFKIRYQWYEDDCGEILLCKDVSKEEFETDLFEARKFAESLMGKEIKKGHYLGKGYSIECLPEYYKQIIWFLIKEKRYTESNFDQDIEYFVDDDCCGKKISLTKRIQKIDWEKVNIKNKKSTK